LASIASTLKRTIATLALVGAAAAATFGSGVAHAGTSPYLQAAAGNCSVTFNASHFTPGGYADLYVYGSDGLYRSFKEYPIWLPLWGAIPGTFTQTVYDSNNATNLEAIAYDETTHQWSNWSSATEYCLK
jgi:hypothetical protein